MMPSCERSRKTDDLSVPMIHLLSLVAENEVRTQHLYARILMFQDSPGSALRNLIPHFEEASAEDKDHYHAIRECMFRLRGKGFGKRITAQRALPLTAGQQRLHELLALLHQTEASSIRAYSELCSITLEQDYRVFDLSYRNMHDNMLHHELVGEALRQCHHDRAAFSCSGANLL